MNEPIPEASALACPACGGTGGHWEGCRGETYVMQLQQQLAKQHGKMLTLISQNADLQRKGCYMSDTPLTDDYQQAFNNEPDRGASICELVDAFEFARQLERALWKAEAESAEARGNVEKALRELAELNRKLTQLRADVKPLLELLDNAYCNCTNPESASKVEAFLAAHPELKEAP